MNKKVLTAAALISLSVITVADLYDLIILNSNN